MRCETGPCSKTSTPKGIFIVTPSLSRLRAIQPKEIMKIQWNLCIVDTLKIENKMNKMFHIDLEIGNILMSYGKRRVNPITKTKYCSFKT